MLGVTPSGGFSSMGVPPMCITRVSPVQAGPKPALREVEWDGPEIHGQDAHATMPLPAHYELGHTGGGPGHLFSLAFHVTDCHNDADQWKRNEVGK
jgi:hypothetical protein